MKILSDSRQPLSVLHQLYCVTPSLSSTLTSSGFFLFVRTAHSMAHFENLQTLICNTWRMKDQLDLTLLFYFTSYVLNTFRTLIYPSSGACDCVDKLPHRSSCSQLVVCVGDLVRVVLGGVRFAGFSLQNEHHQIPAATKAPTHNELRTRRPMW